MKTKNTWTSADMPDQTGKIAVVTGANSGLGYETSLALARKNAHVIMACRNLEKAEVARAQIVEQVPDAEADVMKLDLASLASVRAFAEEFTSRNNHLDMLINNAGIALIPRQETTDGFEMQFGVNHLGHFALTDLLLDILLSTPGSRIVTVVTLGHHAARMNFDDLQGEKSYSPFRAYVQSNLANVLFAFELQRKLEAVDAKTMSLAVHPGFVDTPMTQGFARSGMLLERIVRAAAPFIAQSAAVGALSQLFAATAPEVKGHEFYGPRFYLRGYPQRQKAARAAYNANTAARLWEISKELTGGHYAQLNRRVSLI
jgi:NAD(P)-dependent dehydrogenase (short-subunit alcohol dehydrogenase family)